MVETLTLETVNEEYENLPVVFQSDGGTEQGEIPAEEFERILEERKCTQFNS